MATITIPALAIDGAAAWFKKYPNATNVWAAPDGKLFLNQIAALSHAKLNGLPRNAWHITPTMIAAQPVAVAPDLAKAEKDLANANAEMAAAKTKTKTKQEPSETDQA